MLHAQDMKTVFIALPDSLAPLLTKVNREDFVDFMESDMKSEVKNRFDKPSEMKRLTDDYLFIQITERSSMEMKLLPLNDSVRVVCMVYTLCGPVCDSRVRFYDTQWQELATDDFIRLPDAEAFYEPSAEDDNAVRAREKADLVLVQAALSAENTQIVFTYTTSDYLAKEERELLSAYLRKEPVVYEWTAGKFRPL